MASRATTKRTAASKRQAAAARTPSKSGKTSAAPTDTGLLAEVKQQHRDVEALITRPDADSDLKSIVEQVAEKWIPHTLIEEQIILPAIEKAGADEPALAEATVRRDLVKLLLADLTDNPDDPQAAAKFAVLSSEIESLIAVEEKPDDGVLALAETHNVDLDALKPEVDQRLSDLKSNTEGERDNALEPTSLRFMRSRHHRQNEEYSSMPYESNVRERDENGRFMSDDDRGRSSRSSRDYDDDYRRSGSNGGGPGRDEEGRFTSGGSRSSRDYDDDRRGGRNEGRGWYGDSRGHSEAAREGWDERRGSSRSASDYDDDRRGGYRGNERDRDEYGRFTSDDDRGSSRSARDYDDDRRGGGRGHGGWFGDPQGHSEAAREGWDDRRGGGNYRAARDYDDDRRGGGGRGHGGWFGDPQGHSEAAREGWDDRRGGGQSRSSRDYDDDRRGGGGRGHGGWFGDPQGHSEASREGWEHRR